MLGIPGKNSFILNCPEGFDLQQEIRQASRVIVITAFARTSGWKLIREAVKETAASVELLAGLDFLQTEPAVLREWISDDYKHAAPYVFLGRPIFHPKVIIIEHGVADKTFAIIGSGNLTNGGFNSNVECNVYLEDSAQIQQLTTWYQELLNSGANRLTPSIVEEYAEKHRQSSPQKNKLDEELKQQLSSLEQQARERAELLRWEGAKRDFNRYLASAEYKANGGYIERQATAAKIRKLLDYPNFNFDRDAWDQFFSFPEMGAIDQRSKFKIFDEDEGNLKRCVRQLIDEQIPLRDRVNNIIDHNNHDGVKYVGKNIASKILAVHNPALWPVLNKPVEVALESYGFRAAAVSDEGKKYAAFAELMQRFVEETDGEDMLQLDCFLYWKGNQ